MQIGQLIYPKTKSGAQFLLPLWGDSIGIIVAKEFYTDCNIDEDSPLERTRWMVFIDGDIMSATNTMLRQFFDCR